MPHPGTPELMPDERGFPDDACDWSTSDAGRFLERYRRRTVQDRETGRKGQLRAVINRTAYIANADGTEFRTLCGNLDVLADGEEHDNEGQDDEAHA